MLDFITPTRARAVAPKRTRTGQQQQHGQRKLPPYRSLPSRHATVIAAAGSSAPLLPALLLPSLLPTCAGDSHSVSETASAQNTALATAQATMDDAPPRGPDGRGRAQRRFTGAPLRGFPHAPPCTATTTGAAASFPPASLPCAAAAAALVLLACSAESSLAYSE